MNPDNHDQFAERWLDQALARYSEAEPRTGFEARILANLASAPEPQPRRWLFKLVPVACAAAIAIAIAISVIPRVRTSPVLPPQHVTATGSVPRLETTAPVASATTTRQRRSTPTRTHNARLLPRPEPRRPQFPSPAPISEQERLLLLYATATPQQELSNLLESQKKRERELARLSETKGLTDQPPGREINLIAPPQQVSSPGPDRRGTR